MTLISCRSVISARLCISVVLAASGFLQTVSAKTVSAQIDANRIVQLADQIRFPQEGFQVDVTITTRSPRRDPDIREYRILSKGNENTLVMTTAPAIDRGQIMLMKDKDLWVFLPKVSQPVRLPLSQRLTGQVANGDLARANLTGDYDAKLIRSEDIDGHDFHVLELTAAKRGVTYHRVLYWVNTENHRPYKAEFYARSGRLLKTCFYQNFKLMGGTERPTRLFLRDALRADEESILDYANMRLRKLPDKVFTKQYLKKLQ